MGWTFCVDGLKVSKVVDIPSQQMAFDCESATKIRDGPDWRQITDLQGTWLSGQTLARSVLNQYLFHHVEARLRLHYGIEPSATNDVPAKHSMPKTYERAFCDQYQDCDDILIADRSKGSFRRCASA